jgi:hypothetical protein
LSDIVDPRCHIGKVIFKADNIVAYINNHRNPKYQDGIDSVIAMFDEAPEPVDGFIIMGWNKTYNKVFASWDSGGMPYDLLPEFVKEKLRKQIEHYEDS